MRYHCVQCNEVFTPDPSEEKPRCPKCLRQHGLRPIEAEKPKVQARRIVGPLVAVLALGAAAGAFAIYRQTHHHKPGEVPLEPVEPSELREHVQALAGVDPGPLAQLFEADAKLSEFAEKATKGQNSPDAKAKALVAALQERQRKQAFVPWSRVEPRDGPPLTASATWAAIERDGARKQLYPFELSALAVAALRSRGVPALLAEVYRYPKERTALDPSGRLGYHAVFLPAPGAADKPDKTAGGQLYDAYGARTVQPAAGDYAVLNDAQAVGAAYSLSAMHKLANANDSKAGLADSEIAVKLLPSSASARSVRAALLLATGGVEAGTRELDNAVQLRNDAPRRNNIAVVALVSDGPNRAAKEVAAALAELPDFALARATLATVHLSRGERDQARSELETAERLDPGLPLLSQVWAQFYASGNDFERAIAKAQQAVAHRPKDPQAHLVLAQIFRGAGRYDDMRRQAQEVMQLSSADDRERMKSVLRAVLGPTALEPPSSDDAAPSGSGSLSLGQGPAGDLSAQGEPTPPADPGSLQLRPGASKLHLGGGDSKLKLDLKP